MTLIRDGGIQRNAGQNKGTRIEEEEVMNTYTDRVKKKVPPTHAVVVARAETQKRKIRLITAMGIVGDGTRELTEKQLVEKANIALGLMMREGEDSRPIGTKFVGANKERGFGGVMYELNMMEAVVEKATMSDFLKNMGSTTDFKEQMYEVVMDWILITLKVGQSNFWQAIEQVSGIRTGAIKEVSWIKPIHLHMAGQRTAIAIFKLETQEDANQVIERGLYVEGKKVWGRKQVQEPRRCLKCQCFGEHKAAECKLIHDVYGRCGKHHRTSVCSELDLCMCKLQIS